MRTNDHGPAPAGHDDASRGRGVGKILLLGGTEEARELAAEFVALGADFVTSLPESSSEGYPGGIRRGGFGGVEALSQYLKSGQFAVLVDATDPFAAVISPTAKGAARAAGVRYLRLERRPWHRSASDRWSDVRTVDEAATRIDQGARVLLAVGPVGLGPFLHRRDLTLFVRASEPPDIGSRHDVTRLVDREPPTVEGERALFARSSFDAFVTRNTGDDAGAATLIAARERRTHVFMITRPRGQPWVNARSAEQMLRKLWRYPPR